MVILLIAIALPAISQNAISQKKTDKPAVDALYNQGVRSLQKGDLVAARAAFDKVVRLAPNAPEGHNSLGWVLMTTGHPAEAVAQLRTAVKLKPDFVQAHINLANALAARRDSEGASEAAILAATTEARTAVKLAPSNSEAHRTLGRLLSFRQDLPGAISELRRAVELDPAQPDLHDELGALLTQNSQLDEAATEFSEALRLQPNFAAARLHLGVLRWRQRSFEEAQQLLQSAVGLAPESAEAHYYLARVLADKGDHDGAVRELPVTARFVASTTRRRRRGGCGISPCGRSTA